MSDASVPNNHATSFATISHSMALAAYILPTILLLVWTIQFDSARK